MSESVDPETCEHRPERYYSGLAANERGEPILWVGCRDCGKIWEKVVSVRRPKWRGANE